MPDIQYNRAAPLQSISPGTAAAPELAKGKLGSELASMAANVYEMKVEYDVNNNAADYNEAMTAVDTALTSRKENYTSEELSGLDLSGIETDQNGEAEAWRVYPLALNKTQEQLIAQLGGNIKSAGHRVAWEKSMRDSWGEVLSGAVQKSANMAVESMKDEQVSRYRGAIAVGNYDGAIQALDVSFFGSSPALEREREKLVLEAREAKAVDSLAEISETGTSAEMQAEADNISSQLSASDEGLIQISGAEVSRTTAIKELGKLKTSEAAKNSEEVEFEESSYWSVLLSEDKDKITAMREQISGDGYRGSMEEFKRVQWQTRIDTALKTKDVKLSIDAKVQVNDIMDRLDSGSKSLSLGEDIDTIGIEKDIELLEALPPKALTDEQKIKVKEFRVAQKEYSKTAEFRSMSLPAQGAEIVALKNKTKRTPSQNIRLSNLEQISESKRKLLGDDSVIYAQKYRGAKVSPLVPGSNGFSNEAENRIAIHKGNIEENGISTGPLTQEELADIAAEMDTNPAFFLAYIGEVQSAVGGDSRYYIEQLKDVATPSAVVAAEFMTLDGANGVRAANVLNRGTQIRADKQYPIYDEKVVRNELYARLSRMYPNDRQGADELTEAALDYYVGLQTNPAELKRITGKQPESMSSGVYELNTDVLTDVVNSVTGGESEIDPDGFGDRYTLPSPERGMATEETQAWFDGLRSSDMPEIKRGTVSGGSTRLAEMVVDGEVRLEPVMGERGQYYLRDMISGKLIPAIGKDVKAAVLVYK